MKTIPLTQGKFALVDDDDYEWLSQYSWSAQKSRKVWYAITNLSNGDGTFRSVRMHRLIMDEPELEVDHKDLNGLKARARKPRSGWTNLTPTEATTRPNPTSSAPSCVRLRRPTMPDEPTTHCKHGDCSADEYGPGPCQFPECQVPKDSRLATTESKLSIAVAALEGIEDEVLDICPYFTGDAERKQTSLDLAREAIERINNA